jgi:hypothetical protein
MKSTRHIQLLAAVSVALTILPAIEARTSLPGKHRQCNPTVCSTRTNCQSGSHSGLPEKSHLR